MSRTRLFIVILPVFFLSTIQKLYAQPDLDVILRSGVEDANLLMEAYLEPLAQGVSASLVNGWYNSARAHQPLGFDITITGNAVFIPDADLTFDPSQLGLNNTRLISGDRLVPTVIGSDDLRSTYEYSVDGQVEGTFEGPDGFSLEDNFGVQAIPVPMVQVGVGVGLNSDVKFRVTPTIKYDDVEFQMLGAALMHSISQYMFGEDAPVDLSVLIGFTHVSMEYDMTNTGVPEVETTNGLATLDIRGWTIQGLASKKIGILTLYGGLGYNFSSSEMKLKGDYRIFNEGGILENEISNPINLSYSLDSPRLTMGMRLKLSVITLHTDYTFQKYNTLSAGFGITVR
jgi:hypothetical protein